MPAFMDTLSRMTAEEERWRAEFEEMGEAKVRAHLAMPAGGGIGIGPPARAVAAQLWLGEQDSAVESAKEAGRNAFAAEANRLAAEANQIARHANITAAISIVMSIASVIVSTIALFRSH